MAPRSKAARRRAKRKPLRATPAMRAVLAERQAEAERAQLEQAKEREALQRRDPARWGVAEDLLDAGANEDVVPAGRGGRRRDVFDTLLASGSITSGHHEAARRLVKDWATMWGMAGAANDGPGGGGDAELVSDAMMNARDQVATVMRHVGPHTAQMLAALVEPLVRRGEGDWHAAVELVTGEKDKNRRAVVVRMALENLRQVHQAIDRLEIRVRHRSAELQRIYDEIHVEVMGGKGRAA